MRPGYVKQIVRLLALLWTASLPVRAQGPVNYADWKLEWAEEFIAPIDTMALAERWQFSYPWGRAADEPTENGYFSAQELQTAGGVLNMTMHRQAEPIRYRGKALHYTTPMLYSRHLTDSLRPYNCNPDRGFSYGLFEVRARLSKSYSSPPNFWLYGGTPDEIDVFEGNADAIANNIHLAPGGYWRPSRRGDTWCQCHFYNADPTGNLQQQFHTYGVSWLPNGLIFYFDGIPIRHETRLIPAGCAMSVIVNMAALSWSDQPVDTLHVDYIRVYRPRRLPPVAPTLRPDGNYPQTENAWLPAETQPGRPDQATHQTWQLVPQHNSPQQLALRLIENYNPLCDMALPLPLAGRWAPTWTQINGTPELRVQIATTDSVRWMVCDLHGQPITHGTTAGATTWLPRWEALPPGTYALHLQQAAATMVQPLTIVKRPADSGPTTEWQQPAPPVTDPEPAGSH